MQGRTHNTAGMVLACATILSVGLTKDVVNMENSLAIMGGSLLGSMLPDVDNSQSFLGRILFFLRPFQGTYDHRNRFTHTPVIPLFAILIRMLPCFSYHESLFVMLFSLAYILHLILDTFTAAGVMWLYPFTKKSFSLRGKRSGSFFEPVVGMLLSAVFSYTCIAANII